IRGQFELNFGRRHEEVEEGFRLGLSIYRSIGERWGTAFMLNSLAWLAAWRGEFGLVASYQEEALRLPTELGSREDMAQFRCHLARAHWRLGDHDRARAELAQSAREARAVGLPEVQGHVAAAMAELAYLDGDLVAARAELQRGLDVVADWHVAPQ